MPYHVIFTYYCSIRLYLINIVVLRLYLLTIVRILRLYLIIIVVLGLYLQYKKSVK